MVQLQAILVGGGKALGVETTAIDGWVVAWTFFSARVINHQRTWLSSVNSSWLFFNFMCTTIVTHRYAGSSDIEPIKRNQRQEKIAHSITIWRKLIGFWRTWYVLFLTTSKTMEKGIRQLTTSRERMLKTLSLRESWVFFWLGVYGLNVHR